MTPNLTQPAIVPYAPVYRSDLSRTIGVLQQLQVLCAAQSNNPSLADLIRAVSDIQHEFGENAELEHVIQVLVGRHLAPQLAARRQRHLDVREVQA